MSIELDLSIQDVCISLYVSMPSRASAADTCYLKSHADVRGRKRGNKINRYIHIYIYTRL